MGALTNPRGQAIGMLAVASALVISRWALFPKYLITFDEINFAMAVDRFDPRLSQPQPPGYPVFVALLKLVSRLVPKIETVFLISGLLLSAAALFLLWKLCEQAIGSNAGIVGAALLLFNPAFWLAAITNPVRLCFAAGAIGVALCVWLACRRSSAKWLVIAAAALGLSAGARPSLALIMSPLVIWSAWRMRIGIKTAAAALLSSAAAVALWLPALVAICGGPREFVHLLESYTDSQMVETSLLYGAPPAQALHMAWEAVAWSCLGTLSWLWAVPVLRKRRIDSFRTQFLVMWFVPGLLFYAIFHVGDPDHTLGIVPATCVAGAIVLAGWTGDGSRRKRVLLPAIAVFLNVFLFFKPVTVTTKPSTYTPVRWMSDYIADVIEGVGSLRAKGPVTVVMADEMAGWRQLSYYYPDLPVIVFRRGKGALEAREIVGNRTREIAGTNDTVTLPVCGEITWIDPAVRPATVHGPAVQVTRSRVFFAPAGPDEAFDFYDVHFVSAKDTCGQRSVGLWHP